MKTKQKRMHRTGKCNPREHYLWLMRSFTEEINKELRLAVEDAYHITRSHMIDVHNK